MSHRLHALRMANDAKRFEMDEMSPRFERMARRHENGTAPRAVSAYQLFQTPEPLAARLVSLLNLSPGASVLEPSAGLGRIVRALQPHQAKITAVEIAPQCAAELYKLDCQLLQRDFLSIQPAREGACGLIIKDTPEAFYDAVAMNPPFHMRSDIVHILHALKFLKTGGTLAAICMDTHHRETALRGMSSSWEKLPADTFRSEGTSVATVLLTIKKQ